MKRDMFKSSSITLDNKHNELIKKYTNNDNTVIPKYREEIKKLEKLLTKKTNKKMSFEMIKDKINILENKIISLEKEKDDYFLENAKYLFYYFEKKKKYQQ